MEVDAVWMLFARARPPDRPYWRGRRWLAVVDALAWPCLWLLAIRSVPVDLGVAGAVAYAWAITAAMRRAWVATRCNHRYQFTTWRWAKVLGWLLLIGIVLKATMMTS